jgi:hypothetical protein
MDNGENLKFNLAVGFHYELASPHHRTPWGGDGNPNEPT